MENSNPFKSPDSSLSTEAALLNAKFEKILITTFCFPFVIFMFWATYNLITHSRLKVSHWLFDIQFIFISLFCMLSISFVAYFKSSLYYETKFGIFSIVTVIRGIFISVILLISKPLAAICSWLLWPFFGDGTNWPFNEVLTASLKIINSNPLKTFLPFVVVVGVISVVLRIYSKSKYKKANSNAST